MAAGLTPRGEEQARALGASVGPVGVAVHTSFERTRRTAELAWPDALRAAQPELDEIRFGRFEGTCFDDGYAEWVRSVGPAEPCPGGGESRVDAIGRYVRGYAALLERPEEVVALVAHGAPVRYLLLAAADGAPAPVLERVPPAQPFRLERADVERAVERLRRWLAAPAF